MQSSILQHLLYSRYVSTFYIKRKLNQFCRWNQKGSLQKSTPLNFDGGNQ